MSSSATTKYVPPHKRGLQPLATPPPSRTPSPPLSPSLSSPTSSPPTPPPSPPVTRGLKGSWRVGAAPPSSTDKNLPSFDNVELGMVFYLPTEEKLVGSKIHEYMKGTDQNPWCHPAVVVGKEIDFQGVECVQIRLCTTFNGHTVTEKKPPHQQRLFMLADNNQDDKPHPGTTLAKMIGARFSKRTYVNLSENSEYDVEYMYLTSYNGKPPMRFDRESVQKIRSLRPY
ncbi:hypothetical protein HBI65_243070 [Parastagonospora nodorum]|nr:hypothetical protein HBI45_235070 [Parastagonospora nodorum]KAH5674691.1 hypothetical protein HBI21_136950 [Parastagonospora nodorum]KAH6073707.1 hypothetical protein HBI65_243070 [Parastagonospora nodorum]